VRSLALDPVTYFADVVMQIAPDVALPVDSRVAVGSFSLLGRSAVIITIGQAPQLVAAGGTLTNTTDVVPIEDQLGRQIFSGGGALGDGVPDPAAGGVSGLGGFGSTGLLGE